MNYNQMLKKKSSGSQSKRRATEINIGEHRRKVLKRANNVDHYYLNVLDSQEKMYDDLLQIISERRDKIISQEIKNKRFNDKFQQLKKAEIADEILQQWKILREKVLKDQKDNIEPYEEKQLKAMEKIILDAHNKVSIKKTSSAFNWFKAIASNIFTVGSGISLLFSIKDIMSPWKDTSGKKKEWNKIMIEVNNGIREYEASPEAKAKRGAATVVKKAGGAANTIGNAVVGAASGAMSSLGLDNIIGKDSNKETNLSSEKNTNLTINTVGTFHPRSITLEEVPVRFQNLRTAIQRRDTYLAADA